MTLDPKEITDKGYSKFSWVLTRYIMVSVKRKFTTVLILIHGTHLAAVIASTLTQLCPQGTAASCLQ